MGINQPSARSIAGVQIPDSDSLHADCCGPAYHYDSLGDRIQRARRDKQLGSYDHQPAI
jgi:hypothetical protein